MAVYDRIQITRPRATWARMGWGKTNGYKKIADGLFPSPISLGPRASGFVDAETDLVLRAMVAGKTEDEIRALVRQIEAARKVAA